jgi:hypothetical protein
MTAARTPAHHLIARLRDGDTDRGAALLWAAVLGTVLGLLGLLVLHTTASGAAGEARDATGSANVSQLVQAAQTQVVLHGTTLHAELQKAVAECACGIGLDPVRDVLSYRNGDRVVSVDAATGARTSSPAGATTLPRYTRSQPQIVIDLDTN